MSTGDFSVCKREVYGKFLQHQVMLELSGLVFIVSEVTVGAPVTFGERSER